MSKLFDFLINVLFLSLFIQSLCNFAESMAKSHHTANTNNVSESENNWQCITSHYAMKVPFFHFFLSLIKKENEKKNIVITWYFIFLHNLLEALQSFSNGGDKNVSLFWIPFFLTDKKKREYFRSINIIMQKRNQE